MTPFEQAQAMVGELQRETGKVFYLNKRDESGNMTGETIEFEDKHGAAWAAIRLGYVPTWQAKVAQRFGAFLAEIEPCEDRDSVYCDVTHISTGVSNSLNMLDNHGEFDDLPEHSDIPVRINQKIVDQIDDWARSHGY